MRLSRSEFSIRAQWKCAEWKRSDQLVSGTSGTRPVITNAIEPSQPARHMWRLTLPAGTTGTQDLGHIPVCWLELSVQKKKLRRIAQLPWSLGLAIYETLENRSIRIAIYVGPQEARELLRRGTLPGRQHYWSEWQVVAWHDPPTTSKSCGRIARVTASQEGGRDPASRSDPTQRGSEKHQHRQRHKDWCEKASSLHRARGWTAC